MSVQAEYCTFIDRLGTVISLARLIRNGTTTNYMNLATDGAWKVDLDALDWSFTAPVNRFDPAERSAASMGEALEAIAASCDAQAVTAWSNFAQWWYKNSFMASLVTNRIKRCTIQGVDVPIPNSLIRTNSFPTFVRWVRGLLSEAANLSAVSFYISASRTFRVRVRCYDNSDTELEDLIFDFVL